MAVVEREPVGIQGFDELIEGGVPRYSITLISGAAGTGKSIFAQQFAYTGATKYDQRVLYISLEQRVPDIWNQAKRLGMDFEPLQRAGKVRFIFMDITQRKLAEGKTYIDLIREEARAFGAQRLVIDSLTPLANFPITTAELAYYGIIGEMDKLMLSSISQDLMVRMQVHKLIMALKDVDCTSLILSEIPKDSVWLSDDHVSEFMADGVVVLFPPGSTGRMHRSLLVEKMRATKHIEDYLDLSITDKGLIVRRPEDAMKL
jgi:circadian clock protein KaiC